MQESLIDKLDKKLFIRNIKDKTFYQIYNFAMKRQKLTNEEKNIILKELISSGNSMQIITFILDIKWLTKEDIDMITEVVAKYSAQEIFDFAVRCEKLSSKNLDLLTEAIVKNHYYKYIVGFAQKIKNLSPKNISVLARAIAKSNNYEYIYDFSYSIKKMSNNDKTILVKSIIKFDNAETIFDFADNISWLEKEHIDLLIEALKNTTSGYYINEFVNRFCNDLLKEQIDTLVDAIINTEEAAPIAWFAQLTELTKENKDKLTNALVDLKDAESIREFAIKVKDLSKDNINDLANAIVKTDSSGELYLFLVMVPKLSKEKCKLILDRLFELKDFGVIKLLIDDYLVKAYNERIGSDFEKRIIETKDIFVIAYYLFRKADEILIKQFFDTMEKFVLFVFINKSKLGLEDNDIKMVKKAADFKYVDDNISKYLGSKKVLGN